MLIWGNCQMVDSTAFMLINELTTGRVRHFANVFLGIALFLSGLLGNLFTVYLQKYSTLYLLVIAGFLVFYVLVFFFVPKSPSLMF